MNEKLILRQEKYALIQLLAYLWVSFMAIYRHGFDHVLVGAGMVLVLAILVYFSFYAVEIVINETALIRGNKLPFIKKRFKQVEIQRSAYQGVKIGQNSKKYFDIYASGANENQITLAVLPNRLPAEAKQLEFETLMSNYWSKQN